MNQADEPPFFTIPFANGAGASYIRTIPTASQTPTSTDAPASLTDGFPPETFASAGAIPPSGKDFNGILNWITSFVRRKQAGASPVYDSTFSTAIGGYPKGAQLLSPSKTGVVWFNTTDGNTTDPDGSSASGWVKLFDRGVTSGGVQWRKWPAGDGTFMIRMAGSLTFSTETYTDVTFPYTLSSITDWGASTTLLTSNDVTDQMAQVYNPTTSGLRVWMQKMGGGSFTWPIAARWWAEGILA